MSGYAILGAGPDRVITVRLKNALDLAKGQSALARAASLIPGAGPDFVEGQTYEAVAEKINESLAAQKAVAEVRVIDGSGIVPAPRTFFTAPSRPTPSAADEPESDVWKFTRTYGWGVAAGVGLSGIALLLWRYLRS